MKILRKDLKHNTVKLMAETAEDLWYLSQLIDQGDVVKGKTARKVKKTEETEATKRAVILTIRTDKVEYAPSLNALRIGGSITEGPDDIPRGSHHTINVEPGTTLTITKEHWYRYQLDKLQEATERPPAKILICVLDREDAYFALMKRKGAELLSHLKGDVEKKRIDVKVTTNFYQQIIKTLEEYDKRYKLDFIVLASPAFWKEELLKTLQNDSLRKKIIQASCSSADEQAINEVLKRDEVQSALQQERVSKELILVEHVLAEIAKQGKVTYGMNAVQEAAIAGAIDTLAVTDTLIQKLRQQEAFEPLNRIMQTVDKQKGTIVIVSGDNPGGKKLDGIGGVAALLRYKLSYE